MPDVPEPGPCPHCGAEATLAVGYPEHKVGREFVTEEWNWVRCKDCGATGGIGKTAIEAVEKWNRRITRNEQCNVLQDSRPLTAGV